MKLILVIAATVCVGLTQQLYDTNNDNVDIEAVVNDPVKLKAFMGCFLGTDPCDVIAADFNKDLPEATAQACAKCTPAQKHILKRFLEATKEKIPHDYDKLKQKLDPEDKYYSALELAIANA